jgi:hypothetical protein
VGTGGKARPGRGADHSPHVVPTSKVSRRYTLSPGAYMAVAGHFYFLVLQSTYILKFVELTKAPIKPL